MAFMDGYFIESVVSPDNFVARVEPHRWIAIARSEEEALALVGANTATNSLKFSEYGDPVLKMAQELGLGDGACMPL